MNVYKIDTVLNTKPFLVFATTFSKAHDAADEKLADVKDDVKTIALLGEEISEQMEKDIKSGEMACIINDEPYAIHTPTPTDYARNLLAGLV